MGVILAIIGMFRPFKLQLRSIHCRNKKQSVRLCCGRGRRVLAQYGDHQIHSLFKMNCNLYFGSHIKRNAVGEVPWQSPLLRKFKLCNTSSQTFPRVLKPGLGSSQSHPCIRSFTSFCFFISSSPSCPLPSSSCCQLQRR